MPDGAGERMGKAQKALSEESGSPLRGRKRLFPRKREALCVERKGSFRGGVKRPVHRGRVHFEEKESAPRGPGRSEV